MITVYKPLQLDGYELCQPILGADFENIHLLVNGVVRRETWKPIEMVIIQEDEGQDLLESDSPWLGTHALIFRPEAIKALTPLLQNYGELLPILCEQDQLWIYNPTQVLDAVDIKASSVTRFKDGKVMSIDRYVFRSEVIKDVPIFKIPNLRVSPTYVTQPFVDAWTSAGLRGLKFKRIWEG